ncbi:MAG: type II toxin-antitoxin system HicA family toxin, partial [Butyrivibrio sp.]
EWWLSNSGQVAQWEPEYSIKKLEDAGFVFERHGGNHDIYIKENIKETIPRHKEIDERLAKAILKRNGLL